MLMERLFTSGILRMGPSRTDSARQAGVFNPAAIAGLSAARATEMDKFRWLAGEWDHENQVPPTSVSPAYTDAGVSRFSLCENGTWICAVAADGREMPHITFDPFSRQWIYVLTRGSYGMLRSPAGWQENRIVFTGPMTTIGIDCDWRMTWTRHGNDAFSFINEERLADGSWAYIDKWRFRRRS